jgi:hypothetical protein
MPLVNGIRFHRSLVAPMTDFHRGYAIRWPCNREQCEASPVMNFARQAPSQQFVLEGKAGIDGATAGMQLH